MKSETHFAGKVAQKAVIENGGKVLVMRDPRVADKALWELPGGRLNEDEIPEEGLAREIKEELGIDVLVGKVVYLTQFFQYSENRNALMIAYLAVLTDENAELVLDADEVAEIKWVSKDDYQTLTYFKEYKDTLDRYFATQVNA